METSNVNVPVEQLVRHAWQLLAQVEEPACVSPEQVADFVCDTAGVRGDPRRHQPVRAFVESWIERQQP